MPWYDYLLEQGATYPGMPRKTISPETGEPEYEPSSWSGRLLQGLIKYQQQQEAEIEKQQKEQQRKIDMYKTLRDAGYDPKSAFESVRKGTLLAPIGGKSLKEQQAEVTLRKTTVEAGIKERELREGPKKTETERLVEDINSAKKEEITWDEVKTKYPLKVDQIEKARKQTLPKIRRAGKFRVGTKGWISQIKSKISPYQAELNKDTITVIQNIETEEDLAELLKDRDLYETQGVDIKAILEYFGLTEEEALAGITLSK